MNALPTTRLLFLLLGASVLFLVSAPAALAVDGLLLVLFALDAYLSPVAKLRVESQAPSRLSLGGHGEVTVEVANPTDRSVRVRVTDDLPSILVREGDHELDGEAPPRREAFVRYRVLAARRGDAEYGAVYLRVPGPLGLAVRQRKVPLAQPLRVMPGVAEVRRYRLLSMSRQLREAGFRPVRQRGEGGSFESLRGYAQGDDPRLIDWKATARRRDVIVRQYEVERRQNVMLLVDAGRLMTQQVEGRERIDYALTAALLLADVAALQGDLVGLMVFGERVQQYLPPSRKSLSRLADALGSVHPAIVEPNYPAAFTYLSKQLRRRSLLVLFTDVIDSQASNTLVAHLGRAAQRHLPLVVALRNPELEATAALPPTDVDAVYRRAAAEELLQARASALAQMQRSGVLVADARPTDAIPAIVNRYLDVKRRGLL